MYIQFDQVSKVFGKECVLDAISFELDKGKIYGMVGRNGCGKTVIFKLLTGLMLPTKGSIYKEGIEMTKAKCFPQSVGVLLETPGFIPHYSGLKNLMILNALTKEKVSKEKVSGAMASVGLDPNNKKPVKTYSLGMKQKLGIAQALMNEPELLILDEPMNSLDEESVVKMRELFKRLKDEKGTTILLASHNKEDIQRLCDKIFLIQQGKLSPQDEEGRA